VEQDYEQYVQKLTMLMTRVAKLEVIYPTPTLPKFLSSDSGFLKDYRLKLLNIKGMTFGS